MKPEPLLTFGIRTFWPLFGAIWLAGGVLVILIAAGIAWSDSLFDRHAIVREGRVISKTVHPGSGRSSATRVVTYRFVGLDGQEITGRQAVRTRTWNALDEGTRVRIAYLPNDPSRNRLADGRDIPAALVMFVVGGAVAGLGGALAGWGVTRYRRHRQLSREGVRARATVTAVKETSYRHNRRRLWQVAYRYKDRHGQPHQGCSGYLLPEDVEGLRVGDIRAMRYDPDNPADSIWVGDEKK